MKGFIILLAAFLVGCTGQDNADGVPPEPPRVDPGNAVMVTAQRNYDTYCAHCHGYAGEGQPTGEGTGTVEWTESLGYKAVPRHDEQGHTWKHPDQLLFEIIKYGVENPLNLYPMSSWQEEMSDDEIFAVIDYMKRFWTDEQRLHQAQLTAQFAEDRPRWEQNHLDIYTNDDANTG